MLISKGIFEKEIWMCKELYQKQWWCNWWNCENCWVLLLLHKLHFQEVIEDKNEVKKVKEKYLK